jgi:CheY-like chemotaxis protein
VSLEELGQNIITVTSGEAALQLLLEREFAVILLDVNMPGMSGLETAALIRQRKKSRHTPIFVITAFADDTQTAEGYALGAVDYILSPIVPEILRAKVKVFVQLFQMRALTQSHSLLEQRVADRPPSWSGARNACSPRCTTASGGGAADDPGARVGASGQESAVGVSVHHVAHADRDPQRR